MTDGGGERTAIWQPPWMDVPRHYPDREDAAQMGAEVGRQALGKAFNQLSGERGTILYELATFGKEYEAATMAVANASERLEMIENAQMEFIASTFSNRAVRFHLPPDYQIPFRSFDPRESGWVGDLPVAEKDIFIVVSRRSLKDHSTMTEYQIHFATEHEGQKVIADYPVNDLLVLLDLGIWDFADVPETEKSPQD